MSAFSAGPSLTKRRSAAIATALFAFSSALGCASHPPEEQRVDIRAADGAVLRASVFPAARPGPALLLIHQCNMDRHAWDAFAADLSRAGIHVLTYDQRGYGATGGREQPQSSGADADA